MSKKYVLVKREVYRRRIRLLGFWNRKLAALKVAKGFATNAELAQYLGMSKGGLGNVLSGRQELSVSIKLRILRELREDIDEDVFVELMPPKTRREYKKEIERLYDPAEGGDLKSEDNFWVNRIDDLKYRFKVRTDQELARSLGITRTMISEQRAGKDALSSTAKIRILDKLAYTAARSLLIDLLPPRVRKGFKDFDDLRFRNRGKS